jgi:hypothetical protein
MSTPTLIRWSGLTSVCAGALYALAALLHPVSEDLASVTSSNWLPAHIAYWISAILMQFGLVGLYVRQAKAIGLFGLASFVLAFIGTSIVASIMVMMTTVIPLVATEAADLLTAAMTPPTLALAMFAVGFGLGYLLFGAAMMRAAVLPRWSGLLLIIGVLLFIVSEAQLFDPMLSHVIVTVGDLAFGLGFAWAGYALWSEGNTRERVDQRQRLAHTPTSTAP